MTKKLSKSVFSEEINNVMPDTISWYKHLHQNPELSFEEKNTSNFIYEEIKKISGVDILVRPTKTSVMAVLVGKNPGKKIGLRADIDALPITEETDIDYKSKNTGVMHACGHDGHTTMLLSTLKILASMKDKIHGEIRFFFQHAEEVPPGGAVEMIKTGVMKDIDYVFAFHVFPHSKTGTFFYKEGIVFAASDQFDIKVKGKGVHASMPHLSIDPILIGSYIVTNLQSIVSRRIDPLQIPVLSITGFNSGTAYNVIPEEANIMGTLRSLDINVRDNAKDLIYEIAENIAKAHGTSCEITWHYGYTAGYNNEEAVSIALNALREFLPEESLIDAQKPFFGGEDFTAFQAESKGCMLFVGVGNTDKKTEYPLHSPKFKMDFDAFQYGIAGFLHIVKSLCFK